MAPRTVYANLQDGLQNLSLWDASLADMGSLGVTPCTAAGANAIVLTPIAAVFAPTVTTPQSLQVFSFIAIGNSSGPVTVQIGSTAALKLYKMDGATQATTGDLTLNVTYHICFNAALNSAVGGFQILAPISNEINPIISGATISASTISGSTITTSTYNGNTWTAGTGTLTLGSKTLIASNSLTLVGTDATTMTFPTTSATIARTDTGQTFTGTNAFGVLTATTVNGNTFTTGTYTLTGVAGKTLTFNNSLTLAGTDATTITFPTTSATLARTDAGNTFTGTQNLVSLSVSSAVATDGSKNLVSVTNTGSGNNVLATSPTISTSLVFSPTTGGITGTTAADSASAGIVGEVISSTIAVGSAISLSTGTAANLTSIALTAGDWDVWIVGALTGTATAVTGRRFTLSTTSATENVTAGNHAGDFASNNISSGDIGVTLVQRINISSPATYFATARAFFGSGTCLTYGTLIARRRR